MKAFFGCAAVLAAAVAIPAAQAASRGAACSVTHEDCYPACVQFKNGAEGRDCAQTRNVCRSICGPKPVDASGMQAADVDKLEIVAPTPDKPRVSYESNATYERRPMDEAPLVDTTRDPSNR